MQMGMPHSPQTSVPRIEALAVKNYRVLRDVHLKKLTPLTVCLGPNGSGKTTLFDVFAFLSECFSIGLRKAWDRRGRFKELKTRGADGPIVIELKYRENPESPLITYHLAIEEGEGGPYVAEEWLSWRQGNSYGRPYKFLHFKKGRGYVLTGEKPSEDQRQTEELASPEILAVHTLGQLKRHPLMTALGRFITDWYLSALTADQMRTVPQAGPQERLKATGDNLPNVIQYLKEQDKDRLQSIVQTLCRYMPQLEQVNTELLADGRLLLWIKDKPFSQPIPARFASDGTLQLLALLTVLYDANPPPLIVLEEPEHHLHPRLLRLMAEECRLSAASQVFVMTHSPFFVDGLFPEEVWVLDRDETGYTQARRAAEIRGVVEFMANGALLGDLWMEGHLSVGEKLLPTGRPKS